MPPCADCCGWFLDVLTGRKGATLYFCASVWENKPCIRNLMRLGVVCLGGRLQRYARNAPSYHGILYSLSLSFACARTLYIRQGLYLRRGNGVMFSPLTDVAQATVRHKAEGGFDEVSWPKGRYLVVSRLNHVSLSLRWNPVTCHLEHCSILSGALFHLVCNGIPS